MPIRKRWALLASLALPAFALLFAVSWTFAPGAAAGPRGEGEPALKAPPSTPEMLAQGKQLYAKNCAACHGPEGRADGEAAYLLAPKPRDLVKGNYRLISSSNQVIRVEDIYLTVTRGMPGSSMPPWDRLSENDRWAVSHYVKSLRGEEEAPKVIEAGPAPKRDIQSIARGRQLFVLSCAACHGASGRGDGQTAQLDEKGFPIRPRDLTAGLFKGSKGDYDLYCRIRAGLPGSPMPAYSQFGNEDTWHLIHFIQSLSGPGAESRNRQAFTKLKAERTAAALPEGPADPAWEKLPAQYLALMPLAWRDERAEGVFVRAAYDEKDLIVHLTWEDQSSDAQALHSESFSDGAAVQLSAQADPPFFAMGAQGAPDVRIWFWKAAFETDRTAGFQDVHHANPQMHVPHYQHMRDGPVASKDPQAAALDQHDPTYLTGRGAGNVVSQPKPGGTESLTAHGFGTLARRPVADGGVRAKGEWQRGYYQVLFRRPLKQEGAEGLTLQPGQTCSIAFAVWDGAAGDRNGQKSVTIWHELELAK